MLRLERGKKTKLFNKFVLNATLKLVHKRSEKNACSSLPCRPVPSAPSSYLRCAGLASSRPRAGNHGEAPRPSQRQHGVVTGSKVRRLPNSAESMRRPHRSVPNTPRSVQKCLEHQRHLTLRRKGNLLQPRATPVENEGKTAEKSNRKCHLRAEQCFAHSSACPQVWTRIVHFPRASTCSRFSHY